MTVRGAHYVACLLLALAPAVLVAAPPDVPQNVRAEPGQISEVVIKAPAGQEIGYRLIGDALFRELKTDTPGERVFWFSAKAGGTYSVVWWAKGETASAVTTITTGPPVPPDPKPKPDPKPDPAPDPVAVSWLIVVEETQQRTPAVAAVMGDLAMWRRISAKGVGWRTYDKDSPDAKAKKYDTFAAPVGLPAVLLLDADGKVVRAVKLPATAAELEKLAGGK